MAFRISIPYEQPYNLKEISGVGNALENTTVNSTGSVNISDGWNSTSNPAAFRTESILFRAGSIESFSDVFVRVQVNSGSAYNINMYKYFYMDGDQIPMPLFTRSNPLIFSGDDSGSYTMELRCRTYSSNSGTGSSPIQAIGSLVGLYD